MGPQPHDQQLVLMLPTARFDLEQDSTGGSHPGSTVVVTGIHGVLKTRKPPERDRRGRG